MRIRKLSPVVISFLVLSTFCLSLTILPEDARATTLYVGGGGPGNYTTIQSAIDNATDGDTVYVFNGTYYENVNVYMSLSLIGEDRNATVIDGGVGHAIYITADWVNITGFTVTGRGIGWGSLGIQLSFAHNCKITGNIVSNTLFAINLHHSNNNRIESNNVSNNGFGITLYQSNNNAIVNNSASSNMKYAIHVRSSSRNTITNNVMVEDGIYVEGNSLVHWNTHIIDISNTVNGKPVYYWKNVTGGRIPLGAGQVILANCTGVVIENQNTSNGSVGIQLAFSSGNIVANNTASSNRQEGISILVSHNNTITNNTASSNEGYGTLILGSSNNTITNNTILLNGFGIYLSYSDTNRIYHNDILDNIEQALDYTDTNQWNDEYPSGGNYWSDYAGVDEKSGQYQNQDGSDGIGDRPYSLDWNSVDRYPLMSPFETLHPRPPTELRATLSGKDLENVTLTWALSMDDGMLFKSVIEYQIYRNATYDPNGLGYKSVVSLPNGTSQFVDIFAGEGDPNNYFYQVCAVDWDNNTKCSVRQVAKFTRQLSEGLNLVSIPLIQSNESIETVLQTVHFDNAWSYDPVSQEWRSLIKSKPYGGGFEHVNHEIGFWVNVTQDSNLTVAGFVPETTQIQLRAGWNLVGFPSFQQGYQVADLKADIAADRVERFYPFWPPYHLRALEDFEVLIAGYGYWVHTDSETTWTVVNT